MRWEPWFAAIPANPDPPPDDPALLVNIFKDDPEADPEFVEQWARGDFDDVKEPPPR